MKWKTLLSVTAALALVGPGLAYAQQPPASHKATEDRTAAVETRIAAHKAALKLTPDQEKNWPAYEAALRNLAKLRAERHQEQKPTDPVALLRQRSEDLSHASAALKQLADAEEVLLNSLDDAQKRLFSTYAGSARGRNAGTKN